jgi:predicted CXXCH cytochrome family protein
MLMPKTRGLALWAIMLLDVTIVGCAQTSYAQRVNVQSEACRSCHGPNESSGAKDFSAIYANPKSHHPIGVLYPIGTGADQKFKLPNRQTTNIAFFDTNGNGQPDNDEIQLFGLNGEVTVECASCHKEHGNGAVTSGNMYLRVDNTGSALCITCHRQ